MKKILKYSLLAVLGLSLAAVTGCKKTELDTDQFEGFTVAAVAPNPVMRGGELRIVGGSLENASEVRFAGGITVTDISVVTKGTRSEIRVTVPLEGPEVGKVTVGDKDGRQASTRFDLTFTEPISIDSFSPDVVLSGDVLTIKGEYLNVVKTVIFSGEVMVNEFEGQSRHELSVKVPANALTGPVIVSDVDEVNDDSTIPNRIYTASDLTIGAPTVDSFGGTATVKAGKAFTVSGKHLDMIQTVNLPNAEEIEFTLNGTNTELSFILPAKAKSGTLILKSFNGDQFEVGRIDAVVAKDLTVASLAEDGRFKAGNEVKITGSDLDLVTKVTFGGGVESSFYFSEGALLTQLPAEAKDGAVTVTMESGEQAFSEDIEVVKPVISSWVSSGVAGASRNTVTGSDLDLVTAAKIGTKDQGFIECAFTLDVDEDGATSVVVDIPRLAYTAPITLASAAGYEAETGEVSITYDEALSIAFDAPSFGLGQRIAISGKNLMQIEQVFIKGKKVVDFGLRTDTAMNFAIPEKIGPGVYRLDLVLVDGSELTWPVPFSITAPFTETYYWEGSEDLGSWSNQPYLGGDGALAGHLEVGDQIRIYYTPYADWWQFEVFDGHWGGLSFPELGGTNKVTANNTDPGANFFAFEVTEANIGALTSSQGWGGILVLQGESVVINGLSVIHFGAAETKNVIWEGSVAVDWSGSTAGASGSMDALSWGGYDWSTVAEGTTLALEFERTADEVQIRLGNGSWAALPGTTDPYKPEGSDLRVELTAAMIAEMVANGGLVITGQGYTLKEVALVSTAAVAPAGKTIWEGELSIDWSGTLGEDHKALTTLSWGGYDWSTVAAGTVLRLEYTILGDPEAQLRVANGSWAALPGTEADKYIITDTPFELELTQAMLDELNSAGGMVITGQGITLTAVILI